MELVVQERCEIFVGERMGYSDLLKTTVMQTVVATNSNLLRQSMNVQRLLKTFLRILVRLGLDTSWKNDGVNWMISAFRYNAWALVKTYIMCLRWKATMSAWEEFVVSRKRRSVQECVGGRCPDT